MAVSQPRFKHRIGSRQFTTNKAAREYVRSILHNRPLGRLQDEDDFNAIHDIFKWHYNYENKIGNSRIDSIEIRINEVERGKTRGFWAIKDNGDAISFSYLACFDKESRPRKKFVKACRYAVNHHIQKFKDEFFATAPSPTCPFLGIPLNRDNAHVDHAPPYTMEKIIDSFVNLNGIDLDSPNNCSTEAGILVPLFADDVLRDRFVQYHNSIAQLRVVSQDANLKIIGKGGTDAARKPQNTSA